MAVADEGIMRKFKEIENQLGTGEITLSAALERMNALKEEYLEKIKSEKSKVKNPEQSWHSFIGRKFQSLIYSALSGEVKKLKKNDERFKNLCVLSEGDLKKKENKGLYNLLAIPYPDSPGEDKDRTYFLLPDTDIVVAICDRENPRVLAIISCKTSLRERIAQACYWKLKFLQFEKTRHIRVYLATTDNDGDFDIKSTRRRTGYDGKSRNRVIAEAELDGVYIVKDSFSSESEKVKRYDKLIEDIQKLAEDSLNSCG